LAGDFTGAQANLVEALRIYDSERDRETRFRFGVDFRVTATAYLALTNWHLGEVVGVRELIEEAVAGAVESAHVLTQANTHHNQALFEILRGDAEAVRRIADTLVELSQGHGVALYLAFGSVYSSWARARLGDHATGVRDLRQALAQYTDQGNKLFSPFYQGLLAELEAEEHDPGGALARIDEALALGRQTGERWTDAFLHRIRGDILLKADPENPARAEEAYRAAIAVAREQGARSFGLQPALKLAKLYQSTGCPVEAHDALVPALEGFSPTPEMPEIAEAQALLATLEETDRVRAQAAQRRHMTHLRVAYGNALIAARGFGAAETTEAFAKARESAYGEEDAPELLAADFGLWVSGCVRGELPSMRTRAAAFLRDVEARPDSPEAGVAHRTCGLTHWFAGEYVEARNHLQRALALFQPGRDDDLAFRFGHDVGVSATLWLAFTLWPLGDAECAVSLVGRAQARIADLAHIATHAFGRINAAIFELMRGDHARAAQNAVELARLTREHDLPFWRAFAVFIEGLARAKRRARRRAREHAPRRRTSARTEGSDV